MPHLLLNAREALDLANYLCLSKNAGKTPELPNSPAKESLTGRVSASGQTARRVGRVPEMPPQKQLIDLGKRIVIVKGCNNCHQIAPDGQGFANLYADADFSDIQNPKSHEAGCLATDAGKRGKAQALRPDQRDRQAMTTFCEKVRRVPARRAVSTRPE